jgi:hypothetical protein
MSERSESKGSPSSPEPCRLVSLSALDPPNRLRCGRTEIAVRLLHKRSQFRERDARRGPDPAGAEASRAGIPAEVASEGGPPAGAGKGERASKAFGEAPPVRSRSATETRT